MTARARRGDQAGDRPLAALVGVSKSYGPTEVLGDVDLELHRGEVVALAGENGAGKSTLLKILAGLVPTDRGQVVIEGVAVRRWDVRAAHRAGVAIIPQELAPVPDLTIYENIFLGRERTGRLGLLRRRQMIREASSLLQGFGVELDPQTKMRSLSTATQQLVEILKATSAGCRLLLLDEPTSAISQRETDHLFQVLDGLRAQGVSMGYTTHKMAEMRAIADRVVVLRDGRFVRSENLEDITDDEIVQAMIGRELTSMFPASAATATGGAEPVLSVTGLVTRPGGRPVDLELRPGEFVALAGLMGAGRSRLLETIYGLRHRTAGVIQVGGVTLPSQHRPADAIDAGLALVPEDRKTGGLVLGMSVLSNGVLPRLGRYSTAGVLRRRRAVAAVRQAMIDVRLRFASLGQEVASLSGGNQQKVVIGRWLTGPVRVLLLDEPTRGVDVGARGEIYRVLTDLARREGLAIIFSSSELPEVIGLAHRILVLRAGSVVAQFVRGGTDPALLQEQVFRAAAGLDHDAMKETA